ncbi:MAG: MOSC N-terminal beta barrel domain-containing protein [Cyanobacteria bacterium P01_D01_bin.123]
MAVVSKIWLFPIKSLDGVAVSSACVLPSGALAGDREFALIDERERFINGKRHASIHRLRARFDLAARTVDLGLKDTSATDTFHLDGDRADLERWFGEYFQQPARLVSNAEVGFPDDKRYTGPTCIAERTLAAVAEWYPELDIEQIRQRFRTNIEIADVPPFWEDRLFGSGDRSIPFRVGEVTFEGVNPCLRCVVPTRDPFTGETDPHFQKTFNARRRESLPSWAARDRFDSYYRLAVNTRLAHHNSGGFIHLVDRIALQ